MNKKKEWLSLVNKPWFRRMRGGTQLKLEKEGVDRREARTKVVNNEEKEENPV